MNDKMHDALDEIMDNHLLDAYRPRRRRPHWTVIVIILIIAITMILLPVLRGNLSNKNTEPTHSTTSSSQ
jgi:hypothetical protein